MNDFQQFIHQSRYARWLEGEGRRETWEETVERYINYFNSHYCFSDNDLRDIKGSILELEVMPSMRALMTAGPALEKDHIAGYNCWYRAIKHPNRFSEVMYVLMCGTGVGFSVERQYISQLPEVPEELHETSTVITVRDSKIGWASAFKELVALLYSGQIPSWDTSRVRPAGSRLKTFGGRASGPEPLEDLFRYTVEIFKRASGRRLSSIECHDIVCKTADIVVVGGVRRSALISLSNLTDERMRSAKAGQWWLEEGQRTLANNSVCYTEKPDLGIYMKEMHNLYESQSGERGIFNRVAAKKQAGKNERRDPDHDWGTNPCSEIILRDGQFCNLTEVVVRPEDTLDTLKKKVRIATILGTLQSTLTDFKFIGKDNQRNCEEERLLGVSLTGIMDHPVMSNTGFMIPGNMESDCLSLQTWLQELKEVAIETNKEWSERLGINPSTAITCVKPSGTVSQLVDSASGIHPRFSKYYIRTVRNDKKDPLSNFLIDQGVPYEDEIKYDAQGNRVSGSNWVFSFPMKSPDSSVMVENCGSIEQLELWEIYQDNWCEHKPSMTCYYTDDEFMDVCAWVWKKFDKISGVSFLPKSDHVYKQAPYQEITEEEYLKMKESFPTIKWGEFAGYEKDDNTTGSQEYACTGNQCEV